MSMLEKFLARLKSPVAEDLAGGLGGALGYGKGAAQWAAKKHPMATAGLVGAGAGAYLAHGDDNTDDESPGKALEEEELMRKLGLK